MKFDGFELGGENLFTISRVLLNEMISRRKMEQFRFVRYYLTK